jgi:hypothetical protein
MSVRHPRVALALLAFGVAAVAPVALHAQRAPVRLGAADAGPTLELTPYAGALRLGSYFDGPLGTALRPDVSPVGGAQLALRVSPVLSLVGNVAYGASDLQVGVPILGGLKVGTTSSWLYDAGLELKVPLAPGSRVTPFVQAGGGAITTQLRSGPVDVRRTNAAFNAGGGVDVAIGRTMGVRLGVKDYVGRLSLGEIPGLGGSGRGDVAHNIAVTAGLRLGF